MIFIFIVVDLVLMEDEETEFQLTKKSLLLLSIFAAVIHRSRAA